MGPIFPFHPPFLSAFAATRGVDEDCIQSATARVKHQNEGGWGVEVVLLLKQAETERPQPLSIDGILNHKYNNTARNQ